MKKIFFAVSLFAAFVMTACTPETLNEQLGIPEDAILLSSERFSGHGDKTSVEDLSVKWVNGDKVYLNGTEYIVTVDNGNAYVSASDAIRSGETYGYYGVTAPLSWNSSTKKLTVTVPSEYTSSFDGDRQVIALPMVAYKSDAANKIEFKHVTAAVKVRIKNTTGAAVYLDSVVVSNTTYQLSGTISEIAMSYMENLTIAANSNNVDAADKRVKVSFANKAVTIANGGADIKEVQVPILPVGSDANLTIKVYTHKLVARTGMPSVNYDYNFAHTTTVPVVLSRNVLITAQVEIQNQTNDPNNRITEVDHSLFTINSNGDQVRFSMGNLQYHLSTSDESPWSFHTNQYDRTTTIASGNYSTSTTNPNNGNYIDFFCWGASGIAGSATNGNYLPWKYIFSGTYRDDVLAAATLPNILDWGHNAIYNGGNTTGQWRSLTAAEWDYICNTRENKWFRATVHGVPGVLLLPDDFIDPMTNSGDQGKALYKNLHGSTTGNVYAGDNWKRLEASGAVFLPGTGFRSSSTGITVPGSVLIWTSTSHATDGARAVFLYQNPESSTAPSITTTKISGSDRNFRYYGMAVRLVKRG